MIYAKQVAPKKALARVAGGSKLISLGFGFTAFRNVTPDRHFVILPPIKLDADETYSEAHIYRFGGSRTGTYRCLYSTGTNATGVYLSKIVSQEMVGPAVNFMQWNFNVENIAQFYYSPANKSAKIGGFTLSEGVNNLVFSTGSTSLSLFTISENTFLELRK